MGKEKENKLVVRFCKSSKFNMIQAYQLCQYGFFAYWRRQKAK